MVAVSIAVYSGAHPERPTRHIRAFWATHMTDWEVAHVFIDLIRVLSLAMLSVLYVVFVISRNAQLKQLSQDAGHREAQETARLLHGDGRPNGHMNGGYGTNGAPRETSVSLAGWERPKKTPSRGWWEYVKGFKMLFPYLWPFKDRQLQLDVVFCIGLVILGRIVNVLVPIQTSIIINALAGEDGKGTRLPWTEILLLIVYRYLQGSQGAISCLRSYLWIPVSQYSYRGLSVASFEHVHGLSLDFHLGKKTGELTSALNKGSSINTFLDQVLFSVVPMLVDLVVAVIYFFVYFDTYYGLVAAISTFWYVYCTIRIARYRADIRREMTDADRAEEAFKTDSINAYETVKYFNAEGWEFHRYTNAVLTYQRAEALVNSSLQKLNLAQNSIFTSGLLVVSFIAAGQVSSRQRPIGDFAALLQYMIQLQAPLQFFGTIYRTMQQSMINAERLLEIFKEQPTVVDSPHARPLSSCDGSITFENVRFGYDGHRMALKNCSFECKPGTSTALVGESGGGKSTIFRLLFRYYNALDGQIKLDGHDVEDVTIDSLRKHIGVVPQDAVLFHESIMYNLKYANQNATEEDIYEACRKASIHDRIMTFHKGYDTVVGERGATLSGGERQRVAIARAILKNPQILMLDEATAALDSETEEHIQHAFETVGTGRTTIIIAHRLSTIVGCDQILVVSNGEIKERGTHDELMAKKGVYTSMWRRQMKAQKAIAQAKEAQERADRLSAEANRQPHPSSGDTSANGSDDEGNRPSTTQSAPDSPRDSPRDLRIQALGHSRNASSSSNLINGV